MRFTKRGIIPALVTAVIMAVPAAAAPIVLGIAGNAEVGINFINFGEYPVGAPYNPAPGGGTFQVTAPVTDIFAANGVTPGDMGHITSLTGDIEVPGTPVQPPLQFMTFDTNGSNLTVF